MADLILSVDVGASKTKCFYKDGKTDLGFLWMEPDITSISSTALKPHLELNQAVGGLKPYDQAWVEVRGEKEAQAVGLLAKTLQSIPRLNALKYEGALYKILAAVGSLAQLRGLPERFSLSLITLLPYSEKSSKKLLEPELRKALKSFKFRGQIYQVELQDFECYPEGYGLLALRCREQELQSIDTATIAVCMAGHRNMSLLLFERKALKSGTTTNLGFHQLVQWVADRSAGQDPVQLTPILFKALADDDLSQLRQAVRSRQEKHSALELKQLQEATQIARQEYWRKLQDWFREVVSPDIGEIILGGGAALCFVSDLQDYFDGKRIYWAEEAEEVLKQRFNWTEATATRFLDSYGCFLQLRSKQEAA